MSATAELIGMTAERQQRLAEEIEREGPRLRRFIRRRVDNDADVDDILQDVFSELVESYRLMQPVEQVGAWLFRVARNRITDLFRRKKTVSLAVSPQADDADELLELDDLLPASDDSPETEYLRELMLEELDAALAELPPEQQAVFVAHELEGKSFKELAAATGVSVNTLLSRKRYAVLYLRTRLQTLYDEFKEN